MKEKALLISLLCCIIVNVVYSQNECNRYILKVDSLIKVDNLDTYGKHKPDSLCEKALLDFTKSKGYLGDSTEYYFRHIFLYLSTKSQSDSIRKQSINELLLRNYRFDVDNHFDIRKEDFDERARKRLITLLRRQYSQEEESLYIKDATKYIFADTFYIAQVAYGINKTYREAKDSIMLTILAEYKKELYEKKGYSIHIPLLMGWLNMRECIPLLDSIQSVEGDISTMMALARLGNKEYQEYFLKHKGNDKNVNFYIGTQDLIAKYGNELYSDEKRIFISGPPHLTEAVPIVYNVIIDLQNNILNFPKLITKKQVHFQKDIDSLPDGVLEKARQWMKENKGKYILNPDFRPSIDNATLKPYRNKDNKR